MTGGSSRPLGAQPRRRVATTPTRYEGANRIAFRPQRPLCARWRRRRRNTLTVAIISPATTGLKGGSVASVIAASTRLMRSTAHGRPPGPRPRGEQIGAAGLGPRDTGAVAGDRGRDLGGGLILRHVARLRPRRHDRATPAFQRGATAVRSACLSSARDRPDGSNARRRRRWRSSARPARMSCRQNFTGIRRQTQPSGDLGHDRDRNLGGRDRADASPIGA